MSSRRPLPCVYPYDDAAADNDELWSLRMTIAPPTIELPTKAASARRLAEFVRSQPSREDAEEAIRTLLLWIGENPDREGLRETPARVVRAFEEHFAGYRTDPTDMLRTTFAEVDGYDEMVLLKDISFESHCEHHLAPIIGKAHVAYLPVRRVVGISKLARLVEAFAKRLQIQERLTAQIADTINEVLQPRGVGVVIEATHHCMTTRGVHKQGSSMVTSRLLGEFKTNPETRREFLAIVGKNGADAPWRV